MAQRFIDLESSEFNSSKAASRLRCDDSLRAVRTASCLRSPSLISPTVAPPGFIPTNNRPPALYLVPTYPGCAIQSSFCRRRSIATSGPKRDFGSLLRIECHKSASSRLKVLLMLQIHLGSVVGRRGYFILSNVLGKKVGTRKDEGKSS